LIVPLTKRRKDETLYLRPDKIESLLVELTDQPRKILLERARVSDRNHPSFLPSECLVHFIRASRSDNSDSWFEQLYKILAERVIRAVPRAGESGNSTSLVNENIKDAVFYRFFEMLAEDRKLQADKLDFFEIRFNFAIQRLRLTAQERVWREKNRTDSLDDECNAIVAGNMQSAEIDLFEEGILSDPLLRDRLLRAIDDLPPEQSRTLHLELLGWPIHSSNPEEMTISTALVCSDRSVRNYRKRALKTLTALFSLGNDQ
jgi:hypothetical protein